MATIRKRAVLRGGTRWIADYVDAKVMRRAKQFERRKGTAAYGLGISRIYARTECGRSER